MTPFFDFATEDELAEKARQYDQLFIRLSKDDVTSGYIGNTFDKLSILSDSHAFTHRFKNKVWFYFDGYEDDPREIYQVPECVSYFRELTGSWPFWYHFLDKDSDQMSLIHQLLCDVDVCRVSPEKITCTFKNPEQLKQVMLHLFNGLNHLYDIHGFTEEDVLEATLDVQQAIDDLLG